MSGTTLFELRKTGRDMLRKAGLEEAENDSYELLFHVFGLNRTRYAAESRMEISPDPQITERYFELVRRRASHEPLQYITGRADFMGYTFRVTPDVLIPRFDSETLVAEAAEAAKPGMRVLDLCTGSGCLLIALLLEKEGLRGAGCDISEAALSVARENAAALGVKNAVWYQGDLFEALPDGEEPFDLIISNPPYIRTEVIPTLAEEVRGHEPLTALDGGADGLVFYRRILAEAGKWLKEGGTLIVETGADETGDVRKMMEAAGYTDTAVTYDLGGNARTVRGKYCHVR